MGCGASRERHQLPQKLEPPEEGPRDTVRAHFADPSASPTDCSSRRRNKKNKYQQLDQGAPGVAKQGNLGGMTSVGPGPLPAFPRESTTARGAGASSSGVTARSHVPSVGTLLQALSLSKLSSAVTLESASGRDQWVAAHYDEEGARSEFQAAQRGHGSPRAADGEEGWEGGCGSLMSSAGGFSSTFSSGREAVRPPLRWNCSCSSTPGILGDLEQLDSLPALSPPPHSDWFVPVSSLVQAEGTDSAAASSCVAGSQQHSLRSPHQEWGRTATGEQDELTRGAFSPPGLRMVPLYTIFLESKGRRRSRAGGAVSSRRRLSGRPCLAPWPPWAVGSAAACSLHDKWGTQPSRVGIPPYFWKQQQQALAELLDDLRAQLHRVDSSTSPAPEGLWCYGLHDHPRTLPLRCSRSMSCVWGAGSASRSLQSLVASALARACWCVAEDRHCMRT